MTRKGNCLRISKCKLSLHACHHRWGICKWGQNRSDKSYWGPCSQLEYCQVWDRCEHIPIHAKLLTFWSIFLKIGNQNLTYHLYCDHVYGDLTELFTWALLDQFSQVWPERRHQYLCLLIGLNLWNNFWKTIALFDSAIICKVFLFPLV